MKGYSDDQFVHVYNQSRNKIVFRGHVLKFRKREIINQLSNILKQEHCAFRGRTGILLAKTIHLPILYLIRQGKNKTLMPRHTVSVFYLNWTRA